MVAVGLALPFAPVGTLLGFVTPPWPFFAMPIALVALYLVLAEYGKHGFYRAERSIIARRPRRAMPP